MAKAARKPRAAELPRRRVIKKKESKEPVAEPTPSLHGSGRESFVLLLLMSAVFLGLALYSELSLLYDRQELGTIGTNMMGRVGGVLADLLITLFGWCSFVVVLWPVLLARALWADEEHGVRAALTASFAATCMAVAAACICAVLIGEEEAGLIGVRIALELVPLFNEAGTVLIALAGVLLSLVLTTNFTTASLLAAGGRGIGTVARVSNDAVRAGTKVCTGGIVLGSKTTVNAVRSGSGALRELLRREPKEEPAPKGKKTRKAAKKKEEAFVLGDEDEEDASEAYEEEEEYEEELEDEDEYEDEEEEDEYDEEDEDEYEDDEYEDDEYEDDEDETVLNKGAKLPQPIISRGVAKAIQRAKESAPEPAKPPRQPARDFKLPSLDLLVRSDSGAQTGPQDSDLITNSRRLETALENFRIGGRVLEVHPGPVVTLYQFEPAAGIKVQRIINLADDLALALKVASVRVYAPVPGKGTVGIEVPNAQREMVRLRDVLEASEFRDRQLPLPLALGKDTYGSAFVADLAKMPHLLIAGATGTGKSVCINSLLLSLVYKSTPDELRLIMIDPKMLELSVYEDIPHLKAPVVTNPKRARGVLWWAVEEMERRYQLMKALGVRDLAMYNRSVNEKLSRNGATTKKRRKDVVIELEEKDVVATASPFEGLDRSASELELDGAPQEDHGLEVLPRIVIVVDELADLMLTVGREIEELLTRLAQKARASGIHLILATQRPSVNVITGLIKANFPARVSFKVASKIDARTVMDTSGAEKLLGQGDMLFLSPGLGRVVRLHSPFVSDKEVHDVVEWLRHQGAPDYDASIEKMITKMDEAERTPGGAGGDPNEEYDEFYDQAVQLVVDKGQASTSMVQRAFRIGYNRAARILEIMERDGIVGPADGAKPRQVLISPDGGLI